LPAAEVSTTWRTSSGHTASSRTITLSGSTTRRRVTTVLRRGMSSADASCMEWVVVHEAFMVVVA
jgi:hypothetical protein